MKFSIIVPMYNVAKYIKKCLDSLLNQNFDDYEIILIDDKSTDNTLEEVGNFILNPKIKLIKKEYNSGLSDTRNLGLGLAKGEYILFIDSDDYITVNSLSTLYKKIEDMGKPDVIYMGYIVEKNGDSVKKYGYKIEKNVVYDSCEYLIHELKNRSLSIPACFAAYNNEYIQSKGLRFEKGLLHEDELWTPTVILQAKRIGVVDDAFYHYVIRQNSITQKKDKTQNGLDLITICKKLYKMTDKIEDNKLKKLMKNHISMRYMKAVSLGKLYRTEYKKSIDRFIPLKNTCKMKDKLKALIFCISMRFYSYLSNL
jgi:glycosyltransferase involved in cell wall biosynthesis